MASLKGKKINVIKIIIKKGSYNFNYDCNVFNHFFLRKK